MSSHCLLVSAPREKFLLVPFRKFLLTGWKDGPGTYGTNATRKRLVGLAEAGPAEADYAAQGRRADASQRAVGAQTAAAHEAGGGPSSGPQAARETLEAALERGSAEPDYPDPVTTRVCRIWAHAGGRVSGQQTSDPGRPGDAAEADERGRTMARAAAQSGSRPHLAGAAQPLWRTGAVGQFPARLAGRTGSPTEIDSHDRRRYQPQPAALCRARL